MGNNLSGYLGFVDYGNYGTFYSDYMQQRSPRDPYFRTNWTSQCGINAYYTGCPSDESNFNYLACRNYCVAKHPLPFGKSKKRRLACISECDKAEKTRMQQKFSAQDTEEVLLIDEDIPPSMRPPARAEMPTNTTTNTTLIYVLIAVGFIVALMLGIRMIKKGKTES